MTFPQTFEIVMKPFFVNVAATLLKCIERICLVDMFHHLKKPTKACLDSLYR